MPDDPAAPDLTTALAHLQIELPAGQVAALEAYCRLLWEWNAKVNLTRHTDWATFVARDLTDSLVFAEFLELEERVLDVGSGGGVPGLVLAMLRPDLHVTLSESVGKKARVLEDMVRRLDLEVPVRHARAEDLLKKERFNSLVVRAVARLRKLLVWFKPHWQAFDRLLVIKGRAWLDERGEARHHGQLTGIALRRLKSYPMPSTGRQGRQSNDATAPPEEPAPVSRGSSCGGKELPDTCGTESESVLLQICPPSHLLQSGKCRLRRR